MDGKEQTKMGEFLAAFQVYVSETHIRACRDPGMNFETETSWVTVAYNQGAAMAGMKRCLLNMVKMRKGCGKADGTGESGAEHRR